MIRWLFKWLFRLLAAAAMIALVALVVLSLSYNSILRTGIEQQIRSRTGLDAQIGRFRLEVIQPAVEIQNVKIYNPPRSFGGALFLDIPEIHVEYDRAALARKEIHVTFMRVVLNELDIVRNRAGQTNVFVLGGMAPARTGPPVSIRIHSGYRFTGIDTLNLSFQKLKYVDLANPGNDREQNIGIQDCVIPRVHSARDLSGFFALVYLRSDGLSGALGNGRHRKPAALEKIADYLQTIF
ncbi:MAG: hypothetical protein KGR98_04035 [Verrucomicrobia bacterium]|nr:hypothetical protein [Verrucomicrobiota bacterium]MDE3098593.1 hypothetical protein [Verrucomicrobiota bacterium]